MADNNTAVRSYQKEFKELLTVVFQKRAYFRDFFVGNTIEALDGVQHNKTAFTIKTSDIPVAITENYDTTETVAFGTGTGQSTRFGERKEIVYKDKDVDYTHKWSFHEGIDRFTVNNDLNATVADRLDFQA